MPWMLPISSCNWVFGHFYTHFSGKLFALTQNNLQIQKIHKKLYKIIKFCNPMCIRSWDTGLWTCHKVQTGRECYNISLFRPLTIIMRDSDAPNKLYIVGKVCSSSTTMSQKHCSIWSPTCAYLQPKMRQFMGWTHFEDSYHHEDIELKGQDLLHKQWTICR